MFDLRRLYKIIPVIFSVFLFMFLAPGVAFADFYECGGGVTSQSGAQGEDIAVDFYAWNVSGLDSGSAVLYWGDGQADVISWASGGGDASSLAHTYLSEGTYTISCAPKTLPGTIGVVTVSSAPPPTCQDPSANNFGGSLPCTYSSGICEDPSATNTGSPLPCTYPSGLCEDSAATNYHSSLPCTYGAYTPPPGILNGRVFNDYNSNLVLDSGEPGLAGVTVRLFHCVGATACRDTFPGETDPPQGQSTDATGFYQYSGLDGSASYRLKITEPVGFTATNDPSVVTQPPQLQNFGMHDNTPFNYTLSNSGSSNVSKSSGTSYTTNTITKTKTAGTAAAVTLSVGALPSGVSVAGISDQGCSPTCTSLITFAIAPTTVANTYTVTITGAPLGKQTTFDLVINGNAFTVTCSANPSSARIGEVVTWTAYPAGGVGPFTYTWSGFNIPNSPAPDTNPFDISYGTVGNKLATVTVTDSDSVEASCPPASVLINFDPVFKEF